MARSMGSSWHQRLSLTKSNEHNEYECKTTQSHAQSKQTLGGAAKFSNSRSFSFLACQSSCWAQAPLWHSECRCGRPFTAGLTLSLASIYCVWFLFLKASNSNISTTLSLWWFTAFCFHPIENIVESARFLSMEDLSSTHASSPAAAFYYSHREVVISCCKPLNSQLKAPHGPAWSSDHHS